MESFDGGLNWYGWDGGRKLHLIEPHRGAAELWKGREAYDADNLVGMSCSAWLRDQVHRQCARRRQFHRERWHRS
jgi:hypothetical protein